MASTSSFQPPKQLTMLSKRNDPQCKDKKRGLLSGRPKKKDYGKKLIKLAQQHCWNKVETLLTNTNYEMRMSIMTAKDGFGGNCVHVLCRFDPPLDLFIQVVDLCPSKVREVDNENRTPLFMAAASGASINVINSLLALYPEAATMRDLDGRTPLIAACMHQDPGAIMTRDGQSYRYRQFRIVQELVAVNASIVDCVDNGNMNALDYAIIRRGELKTVILLQKVTAIEQRIRAEWNDSKRRTRLPSIASPSDPPQQNETDSTLPHNPLQWDCYKISRPFEERNAHRLKRLNYCKYKEDVIPFGCDETFFNNTILQFMGMPSENKSEDSISAGKVKDFKIWKTICKFNDSRMQSKTPRTKAVIVDLLDDVSRISDLTIMGENT
jgi:hypothetical protein